MPPLPIEFHPDAIREATDTRLWYEERSLQAASRFVEELDLAVSLAAAHPLRWAMDLNGVRYILFRRFPYALIYMVLDSRVIVIAVAHTRREPGYWLNRISRS